MVEQAEVESALRRILFFRHYYGGIVRQLFLVGAAIIFVATPFIGSLTLLGAGVGVAMGIILVLFAALTNPRQYWVAFADCIVALLFCLVFELGAVQAFKFGGMTSLAFFVSQLLAINFLVALYFAIKTVRGMLVRDAVPPNLEEEVVYDNDKPFDTTPPASPPLY